MASFEGFRILWAEHPKDVVEWIALWDRWPHHEVAAHPAYVSLFVEPDDRAACAVLDLPNGGILFPIIMRSLGREKWATNEQNIWDVTSPYGYGGPFCWGNGFNEQKVFWSGLKQWAANERIISLFARLSLFPEQLALFDGDAIDNAPNVIRWLDLSPEALWMDYEHKVRKNVNHAKREGIRIEIDQKATRLNDFLSIYYDTMDRRRAATSYYFDRGFFDRLVNDLYGQFVFFHAFHGKTIISTELALVSTDYIYSFLGGTRAEAFAFRPNDLLKHEIILWGRRESKKAFVLGGGYGGPDGIFRYKLSFAPHGQVPFRTGHIIFNPEAYNRLVSKRRLWEAARGCEWNPRPEFFPAYRS